MKHSEFEVGKEFQCGERTWLTTDIGTRVVVAICVDECEITHLRNGIETTEKITRSEAEAQGWFNGPPYAVGESVFDEYDMEGCTQLTNREEKNERN